MPRRNQARPGKSPEDRLRAASRAYAAEDPETAARLCRPLIGRRLGLQDRAALARLLSLLGDPAARAELAAAEAAIAAARASTDPGTRGELARALVLLDRADEALPVLAAQLREAPADRDSAMLALRLHLDAGDAGAALDALAPVFDALPDPTRPMLTVAKVLGQAGHRAEALSLLDRAAKGAAGGSAELAHVRAGIEGRAPSGQGRMATEIFDAFAEDYDANLARIENNGPAMIAALLAAVSPPRGRVLDAGCGTGLCARLLRPHATRLTGCDISVPMLEKARAKRAYDALARSDLSEPATLPAGPFDLIVAADVMTYFGDLAPVLRGLAGVLAPGGWVAFTVEEAPEGAPVFGLAASGRYRHRADGLGAMLAAAGLTAPRHSHRATLRTEFGQPVPGLAVAAQRLALFG